MAVTPRSFFRPPGAHKRNYENKAKYLRGNRSLYKPKSGSPFRNLHRRGDSLPLPPHASVDSFNSLQPEGRFCRRQAGRFAPLQERCMVRAASSRAHASRRRMKRAVSKGGLLAAAMHFFTVPARRFSVLFFGRFIVRQRGQHARAFCGGSSLTDINRKKSRYRQAALFCFPRHLQS